MYRTHSLVLADHGLVVHEPYLSIVVRRRAVVPLLMRLLAKPGRRHAVADLAAAANDLQQLLATIRSEGAAELADAVAIHRHEDGTLTAAAAAPNAVEVRS